MQKILVLILLSFTSNSWSNDCSDNIDDYCKGLKSNYEIQACLRKNDTKLSPECKSFLSTEIDANIKLCTLDLIKYCPKNFNKKTNTLNNHIDCLKNNQKKISKKCLNMLKKNSIL